MGSFICLIQIDLFHFNKWISIQISNLSAQRNDRENSVFPYGIICKKGTRGDTVFRSRKKTIDYFERKIRKDLHDLSITVFKEQQKIAEEFNSRGILASGMTGKAILDMIIENYLSSCERTLNLIEQLQKERKIKIKDRLLNLIGDMYIHYYTNSFYKSIEDVYRKNYNRYVGEEMGKNTTNEVLINNIGNQLDFIIKDKIKDIQTYNSLEKEEPSVKVARNIGITSIVITTLLTILNIYFTVFYQK